jgi:hypothetical protein
VEGQASSLGDDGGLTRDGLRVWSVGVGRSLAVDGEKHDEHDPANHRDDAEPSSPSEDALRLLASWAASQEADATAQKLSGE